ncbi:PAS domain-containing protein [Massilia sp. METH4]|uniref:PAS domain-containing hybrid sensor histidine kinase/response regulator n=1 Tax=Massilia sp. METH4 TaxID=3123041 RepID=UPI0030CB3FD1
MSTQAPSTLLAPALGWQLFESSPDCMKLLDAAGCVLAMNGNGLRAMEIGDFSSVAGLAWKSLWPAASHADIDAAIATARDGGTGQFQGMCPTAAGTPKWWDVRIAPVVNPGDGGHCLLVISRNITETRQAERELRAANARMNEIFRQAPAVICVLGGPEHVVELVNDRYLRLVGNRDPVGQPIRRALPEIEGQGYFELLDTVYRTGEPFAGADMPVLLQRHPGMPLERRYVDIVYTPLRDADGQVTGILANAVDVTPRKQAELALYESRERFEKIVSQAATGVVEMDVMGNIVFVNRKYRDMLGYEGDELIGRNVVEVTAPGSLEATLDAMSRLLHDGVGVVIDKHYRRRDGTLMPATSSVNALRDQNGKIHGLVAIVLDTTERERVAQELRASEERYRTLFESMDQGFCIIEMIAGPDGRYADYRFLEMNRMFEEHTGLKGAAGCTAKQLVPGLDEFWVDTYGQVARTGKPVRFESEAAAMQRWFDVYATPSGGPGSGRVALLFTDITARKAADEHLRRLAADLSEADRHKTEFLATLAHELRNPLAPIRSGLGVMRLSNDSGPAVRKVREMMERQVEHMVHLIDDLLDVARISGGKLKLKKTRADLRQVLAGAVETSLPAIEAGRHALTVDMAEEPLEAEVDVVRIAQVVANLLNNAAKYTPPGGAIRLSAVRDGGMAVITVADSGVGLAPESIGKLFEMFSQIGRNLDLAQGGLGIGLSLVRRLVEKHGGQVSASSAGIGAGSQFVVRLPLLGGAGTAAPAEDVPADGAMPDASTLNVLVVDDNVDAATALAMLLELDGHAVRIAHGGLAAMETVRGFTPDIAFLDIGMPGMNGYETARAMRALPRLAGIRLVALTGWGTETDRGRSSEAGFDHHLTKPAQIAEVRAILAGMARNRRA